MIHEAPTHARDDVTEATCIEAFQPGTGSATGWSALRGSPSPSPSSWQPERGRHEHRDFLEKDFYKTLGSSRRER
jgi:hypothetical protein